MSNSAYLVLFLDVSESPPRVVGIEVASECPMTAQLKFRQFEVLEMSSPKGYGVALAELRDVVKSNPFYAWVRPLLSARAKEVLGLSGP